jgi:hypothetical protein
VRVHHAVAPPFEGHRPIGLIEQARGALALEVVQDVGQGLTLQALASTRKEDDETAPPPVTQDSGIRLRAATRRSRPSNTSSRASGDGPCRSRLHGQDPRAARGVPDLAGPDGVALVALDDRALGPPTS